MKNRSSVFLFCLLLMPFLLLAGKPAYGFNGYIDPGSGLLMLQTLGSLAAAGLFYFRRKIAALFGRTFQPEEETPDEVSPITPEAQE